MVLAFGEILLRLGSPFQERLFQSARLEATFGGAEVNVLASLAQLGHKTKLVSAVPGNPVGMAAKRNLLSFGIDVCSVVSKPGRLGIYFSETGANQRPSIVVYDRAGSLFAECRSEDYEWDASMQGAEWFHITGITPAISENAGEAAIKAILVARSRNIPVSLDLNYRSKLWAYGKKASEVMPSLVEMVTLLIANEEDIQMALSIKLPEAISEPNKNRRYQALCEVTMRRFPNLEKIAVTLRESVSADCNGWSAVLFTKNGFIESQTYFVSDIVDRVGVGDSFTAGLIDGIINGKTDKDALEFAVTASCLKHSIKGDINLISREEVDSLLGGNCKGRIVR